MIGNLQFVLAVEAELTLVEQNTVSVAFGIHGQMDNLETVIVDRIRCPDPGADRHQEYRGRLAGGLQDGQFGAGPQSEIDSIRTRVTGVLQRVD